MKTCSKCKKDKPLGDYYKDKRYRYGVKSVCKRCEIKASTKWDKKNPKRTQERKNKWQAKNRIYNKEKVQSSIKTWYINNKEKVKAKTKEWSKNNKDKRREISRRYAQKRRALILNSEGTFTQDEWYKVKQTYKNTCLSCGRKEPDVKLTADHVKPITRGGANTIDNIQPLCQPCNSSKGTKTKDYRIDYQRTSIL